MTRRTLWQLGKACLAGVVAVGLLGTLFERQRLGATESAALARVESEVRSRFSEMAGALSAVATSLAADHARLFRDPTESGAARTLFLRADAVLRAGAGELAVTAYGPTGVPLAWSGRPSELPRDRITGPPALFVAPGPLGPRLIHVEPVFDRPGSGIRLGAVAAERALGSSVGAWAPTADSFRFSTSLAPVLLRARYEGAGQVSDRHTFVILAPTGEPLLEARVAASDLAEARRSWRQRVASVALGVVALTLLLMVGPVLDRRTRARAAAADARATAGAITLIVASRTLLWFATPPFQGTQPLLLAPTDPSLPFDWLMRSPIDLFFTSFTVAAIVALAAVAAERRRRSPTRRQRRLWSPGRSRASFVLAQLGAGTMVTGLILGYQYVLGDLLARSPIDALHFSIHPWHVEHLAMAVGLVVFHAAALCGGAVILWSAFTSWRVRRHDPFATGWPILGWALPALLGIGMAQARGWPVPVWPAVFALAACASATAGAGRAVRWYRRATQGARVIALGVALLVPSLVMYPAVVHFSDQAKRRLLETQFTPQAMRQRDEVQLRLRRSLGQIDRLAALPELVAATERAPSGSPSTDSAFLIWTQTDLAAFRLASAVELYRDDGILVSRFALNLPEYASTAQTWREIGCDWDVYGEVALFGPEERRVVHAGRLLCNGDPTVEERDAPDPTSTGGDAGSIVLHVMLDYGALPFISSQSPYVELFRPNQPVVEREGVPGRDVEFVVYGWDQVPIYMSTGSAWPLDERTFGRIRASRRPFWTRLTRGGLQYDVYFSNDRAGIYALGYPAVPTIGHLINLSELTVLAGLAYLLILVAAPVFATLTGRRAGSGRALLREVRASFYRKLFLAFVAASVAPVLTLAFLSRAYIAAQLRADVESTAVRIAAVARRVVEDYASLQQRGTGALPTLDDDIMVWIGRAIDQDVNIFDGERLLATSERDLFASGLLPTRTPGDVYREIALERRPHYVGAEQVGDFRYFLAAAPVRAGDRERILTVPLMLRQQEIERQIDDLDRLILLATLVFILLGAALGYSLAERIADPVNRLTRATRRIARGDLDARIVSTSADEFHRLVEAFNGMAADLQRQRRDLERTHRLEAWAEMARQVAHEIKNPLTPIQLSAEHIRRVHRDRGAPLAPVLDECLDSILTQVQLLRQISAEFSSFASSPTARLLPTSLAVLVSDVVEPYAPGLAGRVAIDVDVPSALPMLDADRTLLARALTNIIENALHAMPGSGILTIRAALVADGRQVRVTVTDTGVGMDEEAQRRLFEPYFSTKAVGTGLGLTIAKRNVELNRGTIEVHSERGVGTSVILVLPVPDRE